MFCNIFHSRTERLAFITAKYVDRVFYTEPIAEAEEHSEGQQETESVVENSLEAGATITEEETNEENSLKKSNEISS